MVIGWVSIWVSSRVMFKSLIKWIVSMVICLRIEILVKIIVVFDFVCFWGYWVVIYCNVFSFVIIYYFKYYSVGWVGGNGYWCFFLIFVLGI